MIKKLIKKLFICVLVSTLLFSPLSIHAQDSLPLEASAAILVEQTTGRILYARNAHERRYPASTTKMLTALVVMQHLDLDSVVIVGAEIRGMPAGFATNIHVEGEAITVRMLLKALLIRSSNEAGRILAIETIRTIDGNSDVTYNEAKGRFSELMNAYARALGAHNSNFNNPYGLHNDAHFSTAYDLALIGRAFMEIPELVQISAIRQFSGDSMEGRTHHTGQVREFAWQNTNLMLPGAEFGHPYIIGGRTGFTTPAGHCFIGGAYHNGLGLVTVVLYSREPDRWQDTRVLIDHGFVNFEFRELAIENQIFYIAKIENPRLGDIDTLDINLAAGHIEVLSHAEYAAIRREITFDPRLLSELSEHDGNYTVLRAPIEEGETVGTVTYILQNEVIFSSPLIAARQVYERTFDSDMDYYIAMVVNNIFTMRALPYWVGFFGVLFGIFNMCIAISISRRARRLERWHPPEVRRRRS